MSAELEPRVVEITADTSRFDQAMRRVQEVVNLTAWDIDKLQVRIMDQALSPPVQDAWSEFGR